VIAPTCRSVTQTVVLRVLKSETVKRSSPGRTLSEGTTLRRVRYPEIGARTRGDVLDRLPVGPGEVELRAGVVVALLGNPLALVETLHPLEGGARRLEANPRLLVVEGGVVRREENHRTVPLDEVTNPIEDLRDGVGEGSPSPSIRNLPSGLR
jgi:hypothetical protein